MGQTRRENALNAYKTSLANLQALPPTANKTDAENKVNQDKNKVDRLQEDEDNYAKKDNATDIVDRTFGRAEGYLEDLQAQARQERAADTDQQTSSSVWAIQDLVVSPASFVPSIGLCLLAIASVGLTRATSAWSLRTRATPAALPLLG